MEKMYHFILLSLFYFCPGCDSSDEPADKVPERPSNVEYSHTITPPSIHAIDENGYTVYYADSETGDDSNDGLSAQAPFKTLSAVTGLAKGPATKVLFKSGAHFEGNLTLKDLGGTVDKPFIVDIYGGTERAVFNGTGDQVVLIQDDNIRFRNIHITNKTGRRGIRTQAVRAGAMGNIQITGCRFEEINWAGEQEFVGKSPTEISVTAACSDANFNKEYGGIIMEAFTEVETGPSWYENLYITDNEMFQVCRTGILITTRWGNRTGVGEGRNDYIDDDNNWYPCKNVVISNNSMNYIGGDGIILMNSDASFIDHNVCYYANFLGRTGHASVAMFPYSSRNVVMQYNEAAYTQWSNGSSDGEGLDVDIACKNTIVQYNYIHHNVGGGLLMCNKQGADHTGTIVRNNVFLNNGGTTKGSFLVISSAVGKSDIYNNTVITDATNRRILYSDDWSKAGNSKNMTLRNNIFMSTSPAIGIFDHSYIDDPIWNNNLYFNLGNFKSIDPEGRFFDPLITVPEQADGYDKAMLLRPVQEKTFLYGLLFNGMNELDMAGQPATGIGYYGAFAR